MKSNIKRTCIKVGQLKLLIAKEFTTVVNFNLMLPFSLIDYNTKYTDVSNKDMDGLSS